MKKLWIAMLAALMLCSCNFEKPLTFVAGTYEASSDGMNGEVRLKVTFSDSCLTGIEVVEQHETPHVGDVVFEKLTKRMIQANGVGVDVVSGATVSSYAMIQAVMNAASYAHVSDIEQFRRNHEEMESKDPIEGTWDVVIVGAGGAGLAAAAQAAQDGNTVLVIEKNAEMGGNTLLSGGIYQSVVPYLVWDPAHPDATTGIGYDGNTYPKVKSEKGCIEDLETILKWDEKDFDDSYYRAYPFVPGNIIDLSRHGVHAEYRPVLQALKKEISAYLAWARPKLSRGVPESDLTLFSTINLHIFQTYYGGLRQAENKKEWVYGNEELVRQVVEQGQDLRPWLSDMGVKFLEQQIMIVGELWFRGNKMTGADIDTDGDGTAEHYDGNWGAYIMAPYTTFIRANKANRIMKETTAKELIEEKGRVKGVKAQMDDGTEVTAYARKGVIICTGGYAANIRKVMTTNRYWNKQYLSEHMGTTNRASQQGDGIAMGEDVGAAVTGMEWTQLMPMSYADYGNIAFGSVSDAIFISALNGKRFVDETRERDVITIKAFENGMSLFGKSGVYLYIGGEETTEPNEVRGIDIPGKQFACKPDQLHTLLQSMKVDVNTETIMKVIREYDKAVMEGKEPVDVGKRYATSIIGKAKRKADGTYDPSTYSLDDAILTVRILAPATHHTMGGLVVDKWRHVIDLNGKPIPGLYAAGEVTGGIHGGNRLGGNALTEIMVSGRIAASSATLDAGK